MQSISRRGPKNAGATSIAPPPRCPTAATRELATARGLSAILALGAVLGCGSPGKTVLAEAAALEAKGQLEDAAAKLEMGCALSPQAEPCPASDARAAEMWQKAAEKAVTEGRYRDAEKLLHRAMLTADDAGRAAIAEQLKKDELVQGLRYERALMLPEAATTLAILQDVATHETPVAAKAKAWLAREQPVLLAAAVMAACGPQHQGSCTKAWVSLKASGAKGPDFDKAKAAAEAEERRVYPLLVQAEGFLPVFLGRFRRKEELQKCLANMAPDESTKPQLDCFDRVWTGTSPEEKWEADKNQDILFRRTLKQIGDPTLVAAYKARAEAAENNGTFAKQDVPKPAAAPKAP